MKKGIILGAGLILLGVGLFVYYDQFIRGDREARELLTEGKLIYSRGTHEAINKALDIFSKVIAKSSEAAVKAEAYFYIAQGYERLKLNTEAYLNYVYILKSNKNLDPALKKEIELKIARLKTIWWYTDEGIHQLLGMLNSTDNMEFKSRIYSELGYAYLQMGRYQKSKQMFDYALTENGRNEEAILGKARAYKRLGKADAAYNLYEYFLKYYGNYSHYSADIKSSYINQVYNSGFESYRRGKYSAAISYFRRIVAHYPDDAKALNSLYWIGESYFGLKKYNTAISYYNKVLENYNSRKDEDARINKGYAYFLLKKFDLAAREFQIYINAYPRGKHIETAKKWKSMSTQELLQRIQNKMIPDAEEEKPEVSGKKQGSNDASQPSEKESKTNNKGMAGSPDASMAEDIEYENVAEL
jgi:tetratricopeptide (TPR) repeat protein